MANVPVSTVAARVRASAPRLPSTRLVLIDGPAGSGKTTFAALLAEALGAPQVGTAGADEPAAPVPADASVQVLHGDDMYEGWDGIDSVDEVLVDQVLDPLAEGRSGGFQRWDWHRSRRADRIEVPPRAVLIVEGVAVASPRARAHAVLTVWIEAPRDERLRRGIERDGEGMRAQWEQWQDKEGGIHARHGTRAAANVLLDGTAEFSVGDSSR